MKFETSCSPIKIDYKKRIYNAMNYISHNIERDIPLEKIAEVACFSAFHFHRIFKAVVGENVAEFARRLRIELAANRLLADPLRDITSIAMSCGFSSSQNFAKAFRQHFDTSPSRYREVEVHTNFKSVDVPVLVDKVAQDQRIKILLDVRVGEMPIATAVTVRRIGLYADACAEAFLELLTWAQGKVKPGSGKILAFYWDNPEITPADKCRFDCCLTVPEDYIFVDPVYTQKIGGGTWAFCRFEIKPDGFRNAWEESFRWLVESGYECRPLPCCEIYHNDAREHPEGKWMIDIAIPLQDDTKNSRQKN